MSKRKNEDSGGCLSCIGLFIFGAFILSILPFLFDLISILLPIFLIVIGIRLLQPSPKSKTSYSPSSNRTYTSATNRKDVSPNSTVNEAPKKMAHQLESTTAENVGTQKEEKQNINTQQTFNKSNHTNSSSKGHNNSYPKWMQNTSSVEEPEFEETDNRQHSYETDLFQQYIIRDISFVEFIHTLIVNNDLVVTIDNIEDFKHIGALDKIETIDDGAIYLAMLHDSINDNLITIRNSVNTFTTSNLTRKVIEENFTSFEHVAHKLMIQVQTPESVQMYQAFLEKTKQSFEPVPNSQPFLMMMTLYIRVLKTAEIIATLLNRYANNHQQLNNNENTSYDTLNRLTSLLVINEVFTPLSFNVVKDFHQKKLHGNEIREENHAKNIDLVNLGPQLQDVHNKSNIEENDSFNLYFNIAGVTHRKKTVNQALYYLENNIKDFKPFNGYSNEEIKKRYLSIPKYKGLVTEDFLLIPEPTNEHDPNAVKVLVGNKFHIGYVPRECNAEVLDFIQCNPRDLYTSKLEVVGGPIRKYNRRLDRIENDESNHVGFKISLSIKAYTESKIEHQPSILENSMNQNEYQLTDDWSSIDDYMEDMSEKGYINPDGEWEY